MRGIQLTHVLTPAEALDPDRLANYDGLMIYGNHLEITPAQEKALLDFVEGGKGLIAIHCASYMFHNSDKYIALVGGQFQRHGTGEFTAEIVKPDHPARRGREAVCDLGRDLRPHEAQPGRSHGADGARGPGRPRAVHVGEDPGQGPRVLHGLRPR